MRKDWKMFGVVAVFMFSAIYAENISAQELKVLNRSEPIGFVNDTAIEPSAVEAIGNGKFLLVADDKDADGKSLKVVEAATGKMVNLLDKIQPTKKNPKWEGMAKDEFGNYFVIGSHFEDTDAEKLATRSLMFSFRLVNENETDGTKIAIDTATIKPLNVKDSLIANGLYNITPTKTKAKIEGLAVKTNGCRTEIIVGLREPSDFIQVYSATMPTDELKNASPLTLSLKPLFQFNAGKTSDNTPYKLSSIEYITGLKGFLVMTSTETTVNNKPVFHGNSLWFVSDSAIEDARPKLFGESYKSTTVQKLLEFEPTMKAEGICLLPANTPNTFKLAIMFDNDTKDSGMLGKMEFLSLAVKN
jgi:hypothetical protein